MATRTVLLFGQSPLLSGGAANLAQSPGLGVSQVPTREEASRLLAVGIPHVLISGRGQAGQERGTVGLAVCPASGPTAAAASVCILQFIGRLV